jgi:hypothetical protein
MLESTPIEEGQLSYQPGKQIRVRGTAETPVGDAGIVTVAFGIQRFTTDTYDGRNLFRPGSRSDLAASYAFAIGSRESAVVFGSLTRMTAGVSDVRAHHLDYQGFTPAVSDRPGRTITRGGGELRLARGRFTVTPGAEIRVLRRTDGVGQGWIGSFGGRGELTLVGGGFRRRIIAEPGVWFRTGHIVASDAVESGVSGWEASLTLRWEGGR